MIGFLTWWALPSLTCLLILLRTWDDFYKIEEYSEDDWAGVIGCSLIWPIGFIVIFVKMVWPALIRERSFNKKEK